MKAGQPIRIAIQAAAAWLLLSLGAAAQMDEQLPERWSLRGSIGLNYMNTNQATLPNLSSSTYNAPAGDLRLYSDGFILDPRLLHINAGFDFTRAQSRSEVGGINSSGKGWAINTGFLPKSRMPLRVVYTKNLFGSGGYGLNQNNDDSRLDVQWNTLFPNLPKINVGFQRYSNVVHVAQSFADRSYTANGFNLGATDTWAGWQWSANFSTSAGSNNNVAGLSLIAPFKDSSRGASLDLSRQFLDHKARVTFDSRGLWRHDRISNDGSNNSRELYNNVSLAYDVTSKLTARVGYDFTQVRFSGSLAENILPSAGPTSFIALSSLTSNSVFGRVDYRWTRWLRLAEQLRQTWSSTPVKTIETMGSFLESQSSIGVVQKWRGFDLAGTYTGQLRTMGTNFGHNPNSWSNLFDTRVGWGSVRRVHLIGTYSRSRVNLVEQIGGFTQQNRARLEAESGWLESFHLRAGVERSMIDLLNVNGGTKTNSTNVDFTVDHRKFGLTFMHTLGDGAGTLFPNGLIDRSVLVFPLPLDQLLATPLLDRTMTSSGVSGTLRLRRRLDVNGAWRKERNVLALSHQNFNTVEVRATYRLGKMTFEAGYGRYLTEIIANGTLAGNRVRRYYFRIGRDFTIF